MEGGSMYLMNDLARIHANSLRRHEVAAAVRAHFAVRGLRDAAVARMLGMSQSKLSRRTTGETALDTDDLGAIADLFGITVAELVLMPTGVPETSVAVAERRTSDYLSVGSDDSVAPPIDIFSKVPQWPTTSSIISQAPSAS